MNYLGTIIGRYSPTFAALASLREIFRVSVATLPPRIFLENRKGGGPRSVLVRLLVSVIPAWSAGIQADMDVSGRILHTWMPAIHAGMTKLSIFILCGRA